MSSNRQLAAIMFADIEGFTALMHQNEQRANQIREKFAHQTRELVKTHGGRVVQFAGDGALCVFKSSISAVHCAVTLQNAMRQEPVVPLRIGIHSGDIVIDETDIYGDGVNMASRVESFAISGGIFISGRVHEEIKNQEDLTAIPLGKYTFKNIDHPVELFAISNPGIAVPNIKKLSGKGSKYSAIQPLRHNSWVKLAGLMALVALMVFLGLKYLGDKSTSGIQSVAVLPFEGEGIDADSLYLLDGMNEDILTQVSKIRGLNVISNATMKGYKGSKLLPTEIGKELSATKVLRGTVRLRGNNIRVFAELVDVATGSNVWAQTFDESYEKIFEIQSTIAELIASVLKTRLTSVEQDLIRHKQTGNIDAYALYLKGRDLYTRYEKTSTDEAIKLYREAIAADPEYALAWAGLADAYAQKNIRHGEEVTWLDSAFKAATKSVLLDSTLVEGYKAMGSVMFYRGDYNHSLLYLQKAFQINPNYAPVVGNLGTLYFVQARYADALTYQKKSAALNPRTAIPFQIIGWVYRLVGTYDDAVLWLNKSIKIKPLMDAYRELAYTLLLQGKIKEALSVAPVMIALDSSNPRNFEYAGLVAHMAGDIPNAKKWLQRSIDLNPSIGSDPKSIAPISLGQLLLQEGNKVDADIYLSNILQLNMELLKSGSQDDDPCLAVAAVNAIRGNKEDAVLWLKKAQQAQWKDHGFARINPWFKSLQGHQGFESILQTLRQEMETERKLVSK